MRTEASSGGVGLGRGGRLSRQRKRDAVLRLLRGEDLEIVSRALGVTAATLSRWQQAFLAAGEASLATRPTAGEEIESQHLKAIGLPTVENNSDDKSLCPQYRRGVSSCRRLRWVVRPAIQSIP